MKPKVEEWHRKAAASIWTEIVGSAQEAARLEDNEDGSIEAALIGQRSCERVAQIIAEHAPEPQRMAALEQAANLLIDYCEAHDWGMMPEPFNSINPLLKLLGRTE